MCTLSFHMTQIYRAHIPIFRCTWYYNRHQSSIPKEFDQKHAQILFVPRWSKAWIVQQLSNKKIPKVWDIEILQRSDQNLESNLWNVLNEFNQGLQAIENLLLRTWTNISKETLENLIISMKTHIFSDLRDKTFVHSIYK